MYGPYGSFAPSMSSTFATLSKMDTDLLYTTYGDDLGVTYSHRCVCVCVCVCAGVRGWLVISFKSLSLLPTGGAFVRMKTGTLSSLQVRSYLSRLTTGNIRCDLGISSSDS